MERPTFSAFWHRVRAMKPRLRPHVEVTRQHYRGRRWHVVHDPASNQFYRVNPVGHDFVSTLDGQRTVEEAWRLSLAKFADAAPTQNEVIELLSQLYNSNLLAVDSSPETEQLLRRGRERTAKRLQQQAIGIMYFRLKLFNPDRLLTFVEPLLRPVLNRWGLAAWCMLVLAALWTLVDAWPRLVDSFNGLSAGNSPAALAYMIAMFVALKLWHELGHGVLCKRFGGQVPEFGVMLLVLFPSPYVDASACWAFPSKWRRVAVGAGGMLFELFAAAIAAFVYVGSPPDTLASELSYYAILTAGISTVIFNANPLMRFDGYYILADLLEVPNLAGRANKMLHYLFQRYVFRMENPRPPSTLAGERAILVVYGLLSMVYRMVVFLAILLYVLGLFFIVGVLLAAWSFAAWFFLPMGKFAHWLATAPGLSEHRGRAVLTALALLAAGAGVVGFAPLPDYRRGTGVVDTPLKSGIYVLTDGFVTRALVRPGDRVRAGDLLLTMESPELDATVAALEARIDAARVRMTDAFAGDRPPDAARAAQEVALGERQLAEIRRRQSQLEIRAPHDGSIVAEDPARLVGAYATKGQPVCMLVDTSQRRVAAVMRQAEASFLFALKPEDYQVAMRMVSRPWVAVEGTGLRAIPAGQRDLPHQALSYSGGGEIETMPNDATGRAARRGQFNVYIEADPAVLGDAALGQRVHVRFRLPSKPALEQVIDRVHKILQGRVNL